MTEPGFSAVAAVLDHCGVQYSPPVADPEGADYQASAFALGSRRALFRAAKTTPVKAGAFVTLWKRSEEGPIRPFDVADGIDVVVIALAESQGQGQFVFPALELEARGIFSRDGAGGKRAFRVYVPWLRGLNPQATRTQRWQSQFFLETGPDRALDADHARALYL